MTDNLPAEDVEQKIALRHTMPDDLIEALSAALARVKELESENARLETCAQEWEDRGIAKSAQIAALSYLDKSRAETGGGELPSLVLADEPCTLKECPPGLFLSGKYLGLKTEYGTEVNGKRYPEAYTADSGEYWWGVPNAENHADRQKQIVRPVACAPSLAPIAPLAPTDEQVEAGAKAAMLVNYGPLGNWDAIHEPIREDYRRIARAVLTAKEGK